MTRKIKLADAVQKSVFKTVPVPLTCANLSKQAKSVFPKC